MKKLIHLKDIFPSVAKLMMLFFVTTYPVIFFAQTNIVGSLEGEVNVSPMGIATYSIPIEVVPGTQGMQPSLSISYNSASGRGLLGIGWDLSGLSSITRTQRDSYHDNAVGSVNFDGDDRYVLDGARLIKLSGGNYAATNAEYGTEIENFTRVTLKGTPNDTSQYFVAVTSEGTVLKYGGTTNSKQTLGGKILSWWVNMATDPDGNYMSFEYTGTDGDKLPSRILYTGNTAANLGTYAKVEFQYINDPCSNKYWVGGQKMTKAKLLSSVKVRYGSYTVRSYNFEYSHDRSSRLTAVVLKDESENEITRTTISWGDDLTNVSLQSIYNLQDYSVLPGDFNGDNVEDLFLYQYQSNSGITVWLVKKGTGQGGYTSSALSGTINGYIAPGKISVFDKNGDGIDDIGYIHRITGTNNYTCKTICFNGVNFYTETLAQNETGMFFFGDYKGTGNIQVLNPGHEQGNNVILSLEGENVSLEVPSSACIRVTDLNGNGKSDLYVSANNRLNVYEYNESTGSFVKIVNSQWMPHNPAIDAFGDFNGDGKQDYAFIEGNITYMKISKGNDYTREYHMTAYDNIPSSSPMFVGDINGDGKDDIIRAVFNYTTQKLTLNVFYTQKYTDTTVFCATVSIQDDRIFNNNPTMYYFSDMNGDGKMELLYTGSIFDDPVVINFPERREHDLVSSVENGFGMTTSIEYLYNSPTLGNLGIDGKRVHYPLVSKLRQPNGIGGSNTTTYTYGKAVFDYERRQFLGFRRYTSHCNGVNAEMEFECDTTHHYLDMVHAFTYYLLKNEDGGYVADTTYWNTGYYYLHQGETLLAPCYKDLSYGRFVPYSSSTTVENHLENAAETTECWLDTEGRLSRTAVVHKKAKTENGDYPWISRDSTVYTYKSVSLPNGKTVKKPSNIKTWNKRKSYSQMPFRNTAYTYSNGRVDSVYVSDSDGAVGVTSYTYNTFGLPVTETYTPSEMAARTKSYAYDNKGRFLLQETNALGHTHASVYDKYTGCITEETDANNLTTHYQHDFFGRLTRVTRPDQTVRNISYHWNRTGNFPVAIYYSKETETGTPETRTFYDIYGRVVHVYRAGQGYNDIVYDSIGRVEKETYIPYENVNTATGLKTWHSYSYDNYNRITAESCPYTNLSYSYYDVNEPTHHDYFVTVTDNIRHTSQTKTFDALGRLISAEDEGGTINYNYAYQTVSGKIRDRMTVSIGNISTTVVSDIRGNRLSINDPDAGTVTSAYNALNQLVSRTDANHNQTSYQYDLLGRTTSTTYSNGSDMEFVSYTYDNALGKGIGKLASVRHYSDIDSEYEYDTLGRLANRKVYDGNTCYEHLYAYDTLGRLRYLTYPDGFSISHTYNSYGELEKIRDASDNSLVYSIESRNKFRQPLTCRFGNETGTQYTYNSYGMLTGIKNGDIVEYGSIVNGGTPGEIPIIHYFIGSEYRNLTYTYTGRGFIATRSDTRVNQAEEYFYDRLDRLTSYKVNGTTAAVFTYDTIGNITNNTRVGDYHYRGTQPHAVTEIESVGRPSIPDIPFDVTYNLRNKPATMLNSGYNITLDYDASGMRRHTVITNGHTLVKEKTKVSELYELEATPTSSRRLDYIYAEGRIVAVHVDENSAGSLYYVLTDHLGSWEKVLDEDKTVVQQTHFDPWGNRMSHTAWNTPQTQTSFTFDRGFTGHEHYDCIKTINANARLYDPEIGRFFSPDPFVQMPDFTQSYNRYSYCMNNPVMNSDPDGEFFGTVFGFVSDMIDNIFDKTFKNEQWDWSQTQYGWEIDKGLFQADPNKTTGGQAWELISRFTWQLPQTLIGNLLVSTANALEMVSSVTYGYGVTAVDMNSRWGAVTVSNYTAGPSGFKADWRDHLFVHEYGHYIQSQQHGPLYLFSVAIPSLQSGILYDIANISHDNRWFEADASYKGSAYFDKYYGSGKEGYVEESPDYFDKNSFSNFIDSPYKNPRKAGYNWSACPVSGSFHWTDIPISIDSLITLLLLLY